MNSVAAVILAAGKGTRMKSGVVKVLHPAAGRPMISWVVDAARTAGAAPIVLVVGYQADAVRTVFSGAAPAARAASTAQWIIGRPAAG